ncbi:MAG TPA: hypothetical protein VGH66_19945 [Acidimicrobiales bacterium]
MSGRASEGPATRNVPDDIATVAEKVTHWPGPLQVRAAATGQHAEFLHEARLRIDSVAEVLAHQALTENDALAAALVKQLDRAAHFARLAGEPCPSPTETETR